MGISFQYEETDTCNPPKVEQVEAGGKALENVPVSSPLRVQDLDGPGPDLSFGSKIPWQRPNHNRNGWVLRLCRTRAGRPPGAPARHRSRSGEAGGSVMDEQKVLPKFIT
jgi:hypothetical protein